MTAMTQTPSTPPMDKDQNSMDDGAAARAARRAQIINKRGLHARAAAKFVKTNELFGADVTVRRCESAQVCGLGEAVNGRSIMGLMMLGAGQGSWLELTATGADADAALDALAQLIADKFHEDV